MLLKIRNAVDCWSSLLDAPEVGATGAMVVHGGVGAEQRGCCQRDTLGTGGRIQRPRGRTPVRFRHRVHEHLAWARGAPSHAIGQYRRTLRDGFREAQERTVNLEGPLLGRVAESRAERHSQASLQPLWAHVRANATASEAPSAVMPGWQRSKRGRAALVTGIA
jgi:hypothetical protein